jgi:Bacterial TSP3 repeat/Fibronectin type III domain
MHAQRSITVLSIALPLIIVIFSHVEAAPVSVQLSWTAPTEDATGDPLTDLAGYNVYYGLASRSYGNPVNVGLFTSASIADLQEGQTYYFAVTAYDQAGNESAFSGEVARTLSAVDADGDGLSDIEEIAYGTNPTRADSDNDGLSDGAEVAMWGAAWEDDADGDGIINLLDPDADDDGFLDGEEHSRGSDPADSDSMPSGGSITLFEDDFQRANAGVVGNGWVEVESSSRTRIVNGRLVFNANNDSFRPLIRHAFPAQSSGDMVWTFNLNFQRTGPENDYSFWMQLGEGASMSNTNPMEQGVAVNLIWGSPSHGLTTHEGLGYVVNGEVTQVATVSGGSVPITVLVNLDDQSYDVSVGNQQVASIPFAEPISAIDTVRFFAHQLTQGNFTLREIDNVEVR